MTLRWYSSRYCSKRKDDTYINYHHLHFADYEHAILIRLTDVHVSISNVYGTTPRTQDVFRPANIFLKAYKEMYNDVKMKESEQEVGFFVPGYQV